ncbi:MAG: glycosyltransferase family 4 protein [Lachnospiraceae bacterium]|nr:glycosyltransferase family 4 protein [Lachnospiraceae bacterium]
MKIYFFTSGSAPLPAVRGGGVENLIMALAISNEKYRKAEMEIYSIYDSDAQSVAKQYTYTGFNYIKIGRITKIIDKLIWKISNGFLKCNTILLKNLIQRFLIIIHTHKIIKKIVKNEDEGIIVIEHSMLLLHALFGIKKRKNRIYFHAHNNIEHQYKWLTKIVNELDGVISVSSYLRDSNIQLRDGCDRQIVLMNAIDIERFSNKNVDMAKLDALKNRYNSKNKKIILFVGRIDEQKGLLEVIRAFKRLNRDDVKLLIVGSVFYQKNVHSKYELQVYNEAKEGDIEFTGYVDYKDIPLYYKMAYVSVLPSKWEEPAGLVMIESLACGTPIITTKQGGIPEYVRDYARYICVDKKMEIQIEEKLCDILDEDIDEYNFECNQIKNVAKKFDLDNFYQAFFAIFT